ncbi:MAG: hypothetical protein R2800_07875 [Flavipsychrobacter sp.]
MKRLLGALALTLLSFSAFSIPNGGISFWRCTGGQVFTVVIPVGAGICETHTEQWISCHHPFRRDYGYNSVSPITSGPCPPAGGIATGNGKTPILYYASPSFEADLHALQVGELADELTDINNSNVATVPSNYMNAQLMVNNDQLYIDALEFRYALSGYDVDLTDPGVISGCTPIVISLPVVIPENFKPPFNPDCISVSPNPTNTGNLNINFNGHHPNVNSFRLVELNTGIVKYEKSSNIQPLENINTSTFPPGAYGLLVVNGIEEHYINVQVQ